MSIIHYNSPPPSQKQYKFVKSISERLGIQMPEAENYSIEGFKSFISKYSEKFYQIDRDNKEAAKMLDLIHSMEEYEQEFDIQSRSNQNT